MTINNRQSLKEKIKLEARQDYSVRVRKLIPLHGFESITAFSIACNGGHRNTRTSTRLTGGINIYLKSLANESSTLKIPLFYYLDFKEDLVLEKTGKSSRFKDKKGNILVEKYSFDENAGLEDHYIEAREVIADNLLLLRKQKKESQLKTEQELGIFDSNLSNYENSIKTPTLTQLALLANGYKVKIYQLALPIAPEDRKLIGREDGWLAKRKDTEKAALDKLVQETPKEVQRLLLALEPDGVNIPDLMVTLKLKDVQRFTEKYIQPALEQKLIKKVTQKEATDGMDYYKLTRKGRGLREGIER